MTILNCPRCKGDHWGSNECPYIEKPCVICGDLTVMACSDCAIDSGGRVAVHVCKKASCRDEHEKKHVKPAGPKWTPGPWATTTRQGSWDWVVYQVADPNIEICQPFHDDTEENEIGEANARLIAAAPDMLVALKQVEDEMRAGLGSSYGETREQVRRAIKKAEG